MFPTTSRSPQCPKRSVVGGIVPIQTSHPRPLATRSPAPASAIASDLGSTQDLALVPVSEAIFKSQDNRASFGKPCLLGKFRHR